MIQIRIRIRTKLWLHVVVCKDTNKDTSSTNKDTSTNQDANDTDTNKDTE